MSTRTASLQVAHQKGCSNANKTSVDSLAGCSCKPAFYTLHRVQTPEGDYKKVKGPRIRDRREAERELQALIGEIAKGNVKWAAPDERQKAILFPAWVAEYQEILAGRVRAGTLAPSTERHYAETLQLAVESIGHLELRAVGNRQVRKFLNDLGEKVSPATRARRLRELGACFSAAVGEGYCEANPTTAFRKSAEGRGLAKQLKTGRRGTDPFTDAELPRLWETLRNGDGTDARTRPAPVYLALCRVAVTTGARLGELLASDWTDLDLGGPSLRIWRQWSPLDGFTPPKDKEERLLDLTPAAVKVIGEWIEQVGVQTRGPIFTGPHGERLNPDYVWRVLERARNQAGIPKKGETGLRRTFHSFRGTFARQMLEAGRNPEWVRRQLGHAELHLTVSHYGEWSRDALRAEAARVPANLPGL